MSSEYVEEAQGREYWETAPQLPLEVFAVGVIPTKRLTRPRLWPLWTQMERLMLHLLAVYEPSRLACCD